MEAPLWNNQVIFSAQAKIVDAIHMKQETAATEQRLEVQPDLFILQSIQSSHNNKLGGFGLILCIRLVDEMRKRKKIKLAKHNHGRRRVFWNLINS